MKKIYLLLVMCSISMVSFGYGAGRTGSELQTGAHPERTGFGAVVRLSTIFESVTGVMLPVGSSTNSIAERRAVVCIHTSGWLAENNLDAITENNTAGVVPGAGFLLPTVAAIDGAHGTVLASESNSATVRFFAFECASVKQVTGCLRTPVTIYWPLKFVDYV